MQEVSDAPGIRGLTPAASQEDMSSSTALPSSKAKRPPAKFDEGLVLKKRTRFSDYIANARKADEAEPEVDLEVRAERLLCAHMTLW